MTKEELLNKARKLAEVSARGTDAYRDMLEFFESNVCIPKGVNRHPYADVLHEWVEDITKDLEFLDPYYKTWEQSVLDTDANWEYRIKPSEPVYEWQYCHDNCGGKNIVADKYYTDYEYETMMDDKERCIKLPWTKRERT